MNSTHGPGRFPTPLSRPEVAPLLARDVSRLSRSWTSTFTTRDLEQHCLAHPGLSWWVPANGEYLIGGAWRHRAEIAVVQELRARLYSEALVDAYVAACRERDFALIVMLDQHEMRRDSFYARIGFDLIQEIIIYELPRLPRAIPAPAALRFALLAPERFDDLLVVDHAAFPWLWWNSPGEFAAYGALYGVEIFIGYALDGVPVAYTGITAYRGWGHLDRIAVVPDRQGAGYGLEALNFAVARLGSHGARRVGLSTQADNLRSQQLYERYGFHRVTGSDYAIYGRWLKEGTIAKGVAGG